MPTTWQSLGQAALDLLFPRNCVGCAQGVDYAPWRYLCPDCLRQLDIITGPACPVCGVPLEGSVLHPSPCADCRERPRAFTMGRALLRHRGVAAEIVRSLKYRQGRHLLPDLQHLLAQDPALATFTGPAPVFVPVPLHPVRLRERGYNQSLLLAQLLHRLQAGSSVQELLVRTRPTPQQTRLRAEARAANVRGAFALRPGETPELQRPYVLIDDVFTTGATLEACARVLRQAGIHDLRVWCLAHG